MYTNGRKKGTVRFSIKPGMALEQAELAGDFNKWKPVAMRKQKDGSFAVTLELRPGTYEYKFLLDGDWSHDWEVPEQAINRFGTVNSVAVVS